MPGHTHSSTISINEAGEHTHNFKYGGAIDTSRETLSIYDNYYRFPEFTGGLISASGNHTHSVTSSISKTGSDQPHTNMPPYISLNMIIKT